jgi:hypothetical protein
MRLFSATLIGLALFATPLAASAAPGPGSLVKLACPANAPVNDPCKAVYFYGSDGKRHAFPNDKVFFSWYGDFSGVQTVSPTLLASLPLGTNVTYRPGAKLVKFTTDDKTYAVGLGGALRWVTSEQAASSLYGATWNAKVDDISDAFFANYRFGADVATAADFPVAAEMAYAATIDDDLPATRRSVTVATTGGSFAVEVIKLQKSRFRMVTEAAETADCANGCATKPLLTYAQEAGASIGIHGTYFCPPDYGDCATKTNTFLWPFFDTTNRVMRNASSLAVHEGPMLATTTDGAYRFFHRTKDFGSSVAAFESAQATTLDAAVSNYPSLVEGGALVVESESRLDDGMRTVKGTRGGIGYDGRFVHLVIAKSATVVDLARIMKALGATDALNLDGGGSSAIVFDGKYVVGPGRTLPNAILFTPR